MEKRNGIHLLPLPVEKKRPLLKWGLISTALAAFLFAGAKLLTAVAEARVDETVKARVETITAAKIDARLSEHDKELAGLQTSIGAVNGRLDSINLSLGVLLGRTANTYPAGPVLVPLKDRGR